MSASFLPGVIKEFMRYKELGEKAMSQLPESKLFWQYNEESNSIATIVKHMSGNMLSRWTDIFNSDGEKEWRMRDQEFVNDIATRDDLMKIWNKGWDKVFETINSLNDEDLERIIYIRGEAHTVTEAILRQVAHYPHHVGQILFIGKMILNQEWHSLSIPRNKSAEFNVKTFSDSKGQS